MGRVAIPMNTNKGEARIPQDISKLVLLLSLAVSDAIKHINMTQYGAIAGVSVANIVLLLHSSLSGFTTLSSLSIS